MNNEQKSIEETNNKTDLRPEERPVALDPLVSQCGYESQAKVLLECVSNWEALIHWLFAQDFFIDDDGVPLPDELIADYMRDAGATPKQIKRILKACHSEDAASG